MTTPRQYPFSDLSAEQVQMLIRTAHVERSQAIWSFFAALFRRQREAQVWPPKNAPALSLTPYR